MPSTVAPRAANGVFEPIHSIPAHIQNAASPFSKDSSDQNFRGFLHLALLLLFVNMLRLAVENFRKYGWLLSVPGRNVPLTDLVYGTCSMSVLFVNVTISYLLERALMRNPRLVKSRWYWGTIVGNISALLLIPAWIVWTRMYHPLLGSMALSLALIFCMKIVSYHSVNAELRLRWKTTSGTDPYPECPYPTNITLGNVYYFWVAPTLCYQPSYPRIKAFRPKFFAKRLVELAGASVMIHFLTEQYAIPTMQNSLKPFDEADLSGMLERLLKLSISSLYIWLLGFYALFHSVLNACAELLRFGDRMFYKSWWNASSIEEYWRFWNAPVHQWLKRHIYVPMRRTGWSPFMSQSAIFLLSALAHEFLVAVPTGIVQGWAFVAMLMQVPLIAVTSWYMKLRPGSSIGNFFFWICFCILGQPMIVLLYYRAWVDKKSSAIFFFF